MSNLKIANPTILNGVLKFSVVIDTAVIYSADVDLNFDPSKIDWTSIGTATIINPPAFGFTDINYNDDKKNGNFKVVYINTKPTSAGTTLFDVQIKLASNSISSLNVTNISNYENANGNQIAGLESVTLSNGSIAYIDVGTPVLTAGKTTAYTENAAATVIDNTITVTDQDSANLASATVSITAGLTAGDALGFTNTTKITGNFTSGILTLTGSATKAEYETALRAVTFVNSGDTPTATSTTSHLNIFIIT